MSSVLLKSVKLQHVKHSFLHLRKTNIVVYGFQTHRICALIAYAGSSGPHPVPFGRSPDHPATTPGRPNNYILSHPKVRNSLDRPGVRSDRPGTAWTV